MANQDLGAALNHLRVLDLSDEKGVYCGKLFADLGADVILVERPGGSSMRDIPPFVNNIKNSERSISFAYHNTNKRSITLNIESATGKDLYFKLAKTADIIIYSFTPSDIKKLDIGYEKLKDINPSIILTSITPFGLTGPYRNYKGADIVAWATGGMMNQTGDSDDTPVVGPGWQSYYMASVYAAIGTMIALYCRFATGQGQEVDVSLQECIASLLEGTNPIYVYEGKITRRIGSQHPLAYPSRIFQCKDGYWVTNLNNAPLWRNLVEWVTSDGVGMEELTKPEYESLDIRRLDENDKIITPLLNKWGMMHKKTEIFKEGQKRRLPVGPAMSIDEVYDDPHLKSRNFFVEAKHPYMGVMEYPGAPYKFSETSWRINSAAPLIGENNAEIYQELGITKEMMEEMKKDKVI